MPRLLLLCPNDWDRDQLPRSRARWAHRYTLVEHGEGAEHSPATFDALAFVDDTVRRFRDTGIDGVTSSSDYPGCLVAAAVAAEFGLPGPSPEAVLRCSHKYYSRVRQAEAVPEATPRFALVDPHHPEDCPLSFPLFVKPVKSWFSQYARRVETPEALRHFATSPDVRAHLSAFVTPFNQLVRRYTDFERDGGYLLAEECLSGLQVTVEGSVHQGHVSIAGIVDSIMHPGTISFQRFEYPSSLPAPVQARMVDIATRVIPAVGLDECLFNIELFYDAEADRLSIIEINPRMCGQFADLYEMVNGTNTYEILFALASGTPPPTLPDPRQVAQGQHPGPYRIAASCPLRAFEDRRVVRVPDQATIDAVKRDFPVTLVQCYYRPGQRLSDEDQSDGYSYRYGMINLAARSRQDLLSTLAEVERRLDFAFA